MTPATGAALTLAAGLYPVRLWILRNSWGSSRTLTVALSSTGGTPGPIGSPVTRSFTISSGSGGTTQILFKVYLPSTITLLPGSRITLTVTNESPSYYYAVLVYTFFAGANSHVDLNATNDIAAPGSGPILFLDGAIPSGLSYIFASLDSTMDDIDFSGDGCATYTYVPLPDAQGFDGNVTHIRVSPKGAFQGCSTPSAS